MKGKRTGFQSEVLGFPDDVPRVSEMPNGFLDAGGLPESPVGFLRYRDWVFLRYREGFLMDSGIPKAPAEIPDSSERIALHCITSNAARSKAFLSREAV